MSSGIRIQGGLSIVGGIRFEPQSGGGGGEETSSGDLMILSGSEDLQTGSGSEDLNA